MTRRRDQPLYVAQDIIRHLEAAGELIFGRGCKGKGEECEAKRQAWRKALEHAEIKLRKALETATPIGRNFLQFDIGDTTEFPDTGWVFINKNEAEEELIEYTNNDGTLHFLELKTTTTQGL